jgi:hypothetical protein
MPGSQEEHPESQEEYLEDKKNAREVITDLYESNFSV